MEEGAWWATVHGVAKSRTRLSYFTFTLRESDDTSFFTVDHLRIQDLMSVVLYDIKKSEIFWHFSGSKMNR